MQKLAKPLGAIARAAGAIAGVALLGIMLTTVVDVTLRSTFNIAFLGVTEITELGLVVVAGLGIAYCGWTEGHIALEFGERFVPAALWKVAQIVVVLLSASVAGAVAVYSLVEAAAVYSRNAHTNMLQIAEYPFYAVAGLGFLAYTAVLLFKLAGGSGDTAGTAE
ncbi:MAG: TRAP transporter small permease subunit [Rhizobiales bacterium]|nr:TRAP transporter small permease subunit [Hyphomicrobiales bacterium]